MTNFLFSSSPHLSPSLRAKRGNPEAPLDCRVAALLAMTKLDTLFSAPSPRLRGEKKSIRTSPCILAFAGMTMLLLLTTFTFALAGTLPSERLKDPAQESRAVTIFTQLRCLVCQNETIADSDARIAQDLRLLVRTQIKKGDSDKDIVDFIHGRYGDFVLMKPPVKPSTWALWFSPLMLLLIGVMVVAGILHRQKQKPGGIERP